MSDLIEKLSDLRSQFNCFDENERDAYHTLSEAIKVLSEQTELCDDPRADVYYLAEKIGIHRLYALVVELRGEPKPCEDAVSRKDAIIQLSHNKNGDLDCDVIIQHDIETLKQLPSVTPKRKTGKWIEEQHGIKVTLYRCSECGRTVMDDTGYDVAKDFPFCHCSADMRMYKDGNSY